MRASSTRTPRLEGLEAITLKGQRGVGKSQRRAHYRLSASDVVEESSDGPPDQRGGAVDDDEVDVAGVNPEEAGVRALGAVDEDVNAPWWGEELDAPGDVQKRRPQPGQVRAQQTGDHRAAMQKRLARDDRRADADDGVDLVGGCRGDHARWR
jgi:hypothetical protein